MASQHAGSSSLGYHETPRAGMTTLMGDESKTLYQLGELKMLGRLKNRFIDLDAKRLKLLNAHTFRQAQEKVRQAQHEHLRMVAADAQQVLKDMEMQRSIPVHSSDSEGDDELKPVKRPLSIKEAVVKLREFEEQVNSLQEDEMLQEIGVMGDQTRQASAKGVMKRREEAYKQKEEILSNREAALKTAERRLATSVTSTEASAVEHIGDESRSKSDQARQTLQTDGREARLDAKEARLKAIKRSYLLDVKRAEEEKRSLQAWEDDLKKRNDILLVAEEKMKGKREQLENDTAEMTVRKASLEGWEKTLQEQDTLSQFFISALRTTAAASTQCDEQHSQDVSTTTEDVIDKIVFKDSSIQTNTTSADVIDHHRYQKKTTRSRARHWAARSSFHQQAMVAKETYLSATASLNSASDRPAADRMIVDSIKTRSESSLHLESHLDSFHLDQSHLSLLEPNEKINNPIVDFAAAQYLLDYQSKFHLDHLHRTFTYIETDMWNHIHDATSDATITTDPTTKHLRLQPVLEKYPDLFDRDDLIIFPCIETHYFFVVIRNIRYYIYHDFAKEELIRKTTRLAQKSARDLKRELAYDCCILIFDSLYHKPAATTNHRVIAEALETFLSYAAQQQCATTYGPYDTTGLKVTWQTVTVPTQKDKNDCGPCALRYCKQYLSNVDHCIEEVIPMATRDDEFFRPSTMVDARIEVKSLVDTILNTTQKEQLHDSRLPSEKLCWRGLARARRFQELRTLTSCKRKRDCVSLDEPKHVAWEQMYSRESIIPSHKTATSRQKRLRFKIAKSTALASSTPVMAIETKKKAHRIKSKAKQIVEVVID